MNIALVANGYLDEYLLPDIGSADFVIGVDRGAYWLLRHGVMPHIAIGDFDSVTKKELQIIKKKIRRVIEQKSHPKYKIDLELAVGYALKRKPTEVVIYGGIGSRADHTMVAVNLLEKLLQKNIEAKIRDSHNEVFLFDSRRTILRSRQYKYLSLLPYSSKAVVTLRGVLYPVAKHTFHRNSSLGVSNEIVGKSAEIIVHSGIVLVIQSRDRSK
ncbi:thiamine diphosphokinase [Candidatus Gottesmanbacteria bacterium]|nr:thiamine diphosphokinase [Candidatus Gottesmanbacteria bacterium]